jgi:hypothetical protein
MSIYQLKILFTKFYPFYFAVSESVFIMETFFRLTVKQACEELGMKSFKIFKKLLEQSSSPPPGFKNSKVTNSNLF